MKLFFKVIILFLIIFSWKLPYVYNTVFLAILLCAVYYLYTRKSFPFTYFTYRHVVTVLIGTGLLACVVLLITVAHGVYGAGGTLRRLLVQSSMLCALIFALPLFFEDKKDEVYEEAIQIICYAFALQGFIHLCGYLFTPIGDYLISIKSDEIKDLLNDRTKNVDRFRGYALSGSIFFELPSAYGVAFIMFMRLQLKKGQQYITGYKSYLVFSFIFVGIMLTGRTGFVGIVIGILLYFLFVNDPIVILFRILRIAVLLVPVLLIIYFFFLSPVQRTSLETDIFPFAFEFFYNYQKTGKLATGSSNVTIYGFYYPLMDRTLLWGEGTDSIYDVLKFYTFTDAGYMRSLIFGGIPYLFCLLLYQVLYFILPISAAAKYRTKENKIDTWCFVLLFVYMLILHYKDNALGVQHLTEVLFLFIGISYLVRYYTQLEKTPAE